MHAVNADNGVLCTCYSLVGDILSYPSVFVPNHPLNRHTEREPPIERFMRRVFRVGEPPVFSLSLGAQSVQVESDLRNAVVAIKSHDHGSHESAYTMFSLPGMAQYVTVRQSLQHDSSCDLPGTAIGH